MKYLHFYFISIIVLLLIIIMKISSLKENFALTNNFTPTKCLDIINDGANNKLQMADCGNYSGQNWNSEQINNSNYHKLRNDFSSNNKCLDIINDGRNNKLIMADCKNVTGQQWLIPPNMKMQNFFSGSNKCLDIINDGANNKLTMANCGNYSGQQWNRK